MEVEIDRKFLKFGYLDVMRWSDDECREFLEIMRWDGEPICPKCGAGDPYRITRKTRTKNRVSKLLKCRECKRQYSATVGTIFEDSRMPLSKWFAGIYLMCSSKMGISAHQLHRMLGISYKSAWFMCQRIRDAMGNDGDELLKGIIEIDETYVAPRTKRGHPFWEKVNRKAEKLGWIPETPRKGPMEGKTIVLGMTERGGRMRSRVVPDATRETLENAIREEVDVDNSKLVTDGHSSYRSLHRFADHESVNHDTEYVRSDDPSIHTQNIENEWSIFKRGLFGTFFRISDGYLPMYLHEFDFRASTREFIDAHRFAMAVGQTSGRRLTWYCKTPQPENPYA